MVKKLQAYDLRIPLESHLPNVTMHSVTCGVLFLSSIPSLYLLCQTKPATCEEEQSQPQIFDET
jgi:hypothetical protein